MFAWRGTYLRVHDLKKSLGFLLHTAVWKKTPKYAITFDLLYGRIWNFTGVCVLIFLSLGCNLVMWYEQNNKLWNLFLLFPIPSHVNKKPTWRSQLWWLAKFAWYDVTWKPPIAGGFCYGTCQRQSNKWCAIASYMPSLPLSCTEL